MNESPITLKSLLFILSFATIILLGIFCFSFFDTRTKVVFCNVGQGNATYFRVDNSVDILVDAGPDTSVLKCLGKHMPFYDRTLDYVIISHPQNDHFYGLIPILDRYTVKNVMTTPFNSPDANYQLLKKKLKSKSVPIYFPSSGSHMKVLNGTLTYLWPSRDILVQGLGKNEDVNDTSVIVSYRENDKSVLLTGDAPFSILDKALTYNQNHIDILQMPHHGSSTGMTFNLLKKIHPAESIISVGKKNPYGHPTKEILRILQTQKIPYERTDEKGDIVIKL
jgi:competence protein ComEC